MSVSGAADRPPLLKRQVIDLTVSASLTWGETSSPANKTITITNNGPRDQAVEIGFSGDSDGFTVASIGGDDRDSQLLCSAGSVDVVAPAGGSVAIELLPIFTDGSADSMTVTVTHPGGYVYATATATATISDPFVALVEANLPEGGSAMVYSANGQTVSNSGDVCMVDLAGNGPDLAITYASNNGSIQAATIGTNGYDALSAAVQLSAQGTSDYIAPDSLAALPGNITGYIMACKFGSGTTRTNEWIAWRHPGETGNSSGLPEWRMSGGYAEQFNGSIASNKVALGGVSDDTWFWVAHRYDGSDSHVSVTEDQGTWEGVGTASNTLAYTGTRTKVRLFEAVSSSGIKQIGALVLFYGAAPSNADLEAIVTGV